MIPAGSIMRTLGGPDVTHIFMHDLTLPEDVEFLKISPEYASCDERALLVARSHDVVCLSRRVDPGYLRMLRDFGIGPDPENVIECGGTAENDALPLSGRLCRDRSCLEQLSSLLTGGSRIVLNPYATTSSELALANALALLSDRPISVWGGNPDITRRANDKWRGYLMAGKLDIPAPAAERVELRAAEIGKAPDIAPLLRAVARFSKQTGRAMVRGIRGTAGVTNLVADPASPELEADLRRLAGNATTDAYMIQSFFDISVSPNIQLFIDPESGRITCMSITDQQLEQNIAHYGNRCPSTATMIPEMLRSAHRMAAGLREHGYAGPVGFDFVEYMDAGTGKPAQFLAEINARVNAAIYPCALMERIVRRQRQTGGPVPGAFLSANVRTPAASFREFMDIHGHRIFDSRRGLGMIPFHTGALDWGACGIVVMGKSWDEAAALFREIGGES